MRKATDLAQPEVKFIKIRNTDYVYTNNKEQAVDMGGDEKLFAIFRPIKGEVGKILAKEGGYYLAEFERDTDGESFTSQVLVDTVDGCEPHYPVEDVKFVVFHKRGTAVYPLKYVSNEHLESDISKQVASGNISLGDEFEVFEVSNPKQLEINLKFNKV